ncbi:MAG: four helix bundle protein [Leptolyngbyaceae cyanobacterium]
MIQSHRDLVVWQKAMDMVVQVYQLAQHFPSSETYRLTAQVTRSAASVPANIAEGHGRGPNKKEYAHFLSIAKGSLMETETFLILAIRLQYVNTTQAQPTLDLIVEISKMLTTIRRRLRPEP